MDIAYFIYKYICGAGTQEAETLGHSLESLDERCALASPFTLRLRTHHIHRQRTMSEHMHIHLFIYSSH